MSTIRRDLRQVFETILKSWNVSDEEVLADDLASAAIDIIRKPTFDLRNSDPAWAILAGKEVDTEANIKAKEARDAFEVAFGFNPPWFENKDWTDFADAIAKVYQEDKATRVKQGNIWSDYCLWRENPQGGKFGKAMSNVSIRKSPRMFIDTALPTFLAASIMSQGKPKPTQPSFIKDDDDGIPISR